MASRLLPSVTGVSGGVLIRYVLLALVNALGLYGLLTLGGLGMWKLFVFLLIGLIVVDITYATGRLIPAKYLVPGLLLLLLYQVYVVVFTAQTSLTNSAEFNNGTKDQAAAAILERYERRVEGSPAYGVSIVERDGALAMLVTDPDGKVSVGDAEDPLEPVTDATTDPSGKAISAPGYTALPLSALGTRTEEILALRVPISEDPNDGSLKTQDAVSAFVFQPTASYDGDTLTADGVTYTASEGNFVSPTGEKLNPGWKVFVGADNYTKVLTDRALRGPFLSVLLWTFAFALISTLGCFAVGLLSALVLNDPRLKGRRVYRSLLLMPYAIPAVITAGVFKGMFNTDFGFINQVVLFGANIDWLGDPTWAKVTLILVNIWLGYPYMFLVSTGAVQAIPQDVQEAGQVDGGSPWQIFWRIKFFFILSATLPLLIASFAFNFNNYTLVAALTAGGPSMTEADVTVGHTDILITFVFNLAFGGQQALYGLASAVSILIFILVGGISLLSFRQTKRFEEWA